VDQIYRREDQISPLEKTGRPIWNALFRASVAFKDTVSEDYVRLFGMPTVGDAGIDDQMKNSLIDTYLTINQMVEYFRLGILVRITVHAETKTIYQIISNYLLEWKERLNKGINIGGAPIEDLILLDRFASVVFEHAVQHFTPDYVNSRFINQLNGNGLFKSRESLIKIIETPLPAKGEPVYKKHESLSELFSERVISNSSGSRWGRGK
jgi:hypothetical protein